MAEMGVSVFEENDLSQEEVQTAAMGEKVGM
jgi:hypothetical protein